jgi:hypothetical protein
MAMSETKHRKEASVATETLKLTKRHARKILEVVDCGLVHGKGVPEPGKMCVEAAVCFALGLDHSDNPPCVGSAVREFKIGLNDSDWSSPESRARGLRRLSIAQLGSDSLNQTEFVTKLQQAVIRNVVPRALRNAAKSHPAQEHKDALEAAAVKCADEGTESAAESAARSAARSAESAARSAESAARSAARSAESAAWSAARSAMSAAWSAARSAESAARSAESAAWSAARSAESAARSAARSAESAARSAESAAKDKELAFAAEQCVDVLCDMGSPGCKWLDLCDED